MSNKRLSHERLLKFQQGEHWCSKCKQYKPLNEFCKANHCTYGLQTYCKPCSSQHAKNPTYRKTESAKHHSLKKYWVDLMGGKCQRCGYGEFYSSFDFHHVNPDEKEHTPVKTIYSNNKELAKSEIDKCCLLCRNCHQGFTAGLWQGEFIKAELGYTLKHHWLVEPPKKITVYQAPPLFDLRNLTPCNT